MKITTIKWRRFVALVSGVLFLQNASYATDVYYPPVTESLNRLTSTNQFIRDRGMRDLVDMGKAAAPAYDVLITIALSSNNLPKTRSSALFALKNIDATRAATYFIQELTNSSATIREYAVNALMTIKDPRATIPLFNRLNDENNRVRDRAGIALQFYPNKTLEKLLLESLSKPTDKAREYAPWLLGRMHSKAALAPLHNLLTDPSPTFRLSVIAALRDIKSKTSVTPLIQIAEHDKDNNIRVQALQCLGELGDTKAAPTILAALNDEHPEVRASAANAAGKLGIKDAKPRLREILKQGVSKDIIAAMGALCQMKDTNSIPIIVDRINSENYNIFTQYMMLGLVELEAESEIQKLKTNGNPQTQALAEKALKKLKKRKSQVTSPFSEEEFDLGVKLKVTPVEINKSNSKPGPGDVIFVTSDTQTPTNKP